MFDTPVIAMIIRSGWVARLILVSLAVLSVLSWAIIFNRLVVLGKIGRLHALFRKKYAEAPKLTDLESAEERLRTSPMGGLGVIGVSEYRRILDDSSSHAGVKDWSFFLQSQFSMASERIDSTITSWTGRLDKGLILLAIISSAAPFLGLLGTVWGIMNSFFEIGNQGSASLPVVAPGIAEALITTIVGLAVAIPAVFFYNLFMHRVGRIEDELEEARDMILLRIKREVLALLYGGKGGPRER